MRFFIGCLLVIGSVFGAARMAAAQDHGPEYVLACGDSIEISYTYTPEYNQTVTIPSDGVVSLMRVGSVPVVGLTLRAATAAITAAANKSGLNKPEVFLTLRDYVRPQYTVLGQVNKPGRYELHGTLRVADGLAIAGGLNLNARLKYIILVHRISPTDGETTVYDYKALEKKNTAISTVILQDGDIIVVPQGNISKVERFIKLANVGAYYPF
jgi:polysaccharide export outer membrane protein